jgi:hypothetical protein
MRTLERTEDLTRAAVVNLLRAEREWRVFFRRSCEAGVSRLWASSYRQFRDELQTRGEWHTPEEIGDVLLTLAREKLPESPAARWDAEWASRLCREVLERLAEHYSGLTEGECDRLDLKPQDEWQDRMNAAGEENDPAAFRRALAGWERAGLEAFAEARSQKGAVA